MKKKKIRKNSIGARVMRVLRNISNQRDHKVGNIFQLGLNILLSNTSPLL